MWKAIFIQEVLLLKRHQALIAGMVLFLVAGVYGIYYGHTFVRQQQQVLYAVDTAQANRITQHLANYNADTTTKEGKNEYQLACDAYMSDWNTQKMVYYQPTAFTALSIGQKDNYPYYHNLWLLNNVYTNPLEEIRNPDKLLIGNFDLAFVLIYLLPLWIIAFSYNVLSAEKENRTDILLKIYSPSLPHVVAHKLVFRFLITGGAVLLLGVVGFLVNRIPITSQWSSMLAWLLVSLFYTSFWFLLVYWVVSFGSSSTWSALTLMATWLVLLLLIPSILNYYLSTLNSDTERVTLVTVDRDEDDKLWELPAGEIIASFHKAVPTFSPPIFPVVDSANQRFAAFIELSQRQNNAAGEAIDTQQKAAYEQTLGFNWVNPVYTALNAFNQLAGTEVNHYLAYIQAVKAYQQQRRYFIFNYMLSTKPFRKEQYLQFPEFTFVTTPATLGRIMQVSWPLLLWSAVLLAGGYQRLKKV
jgi:ABC-2 type transport system permease protein